MLKQVKFGKFSKATAKPNGHGRLEKVMEKVIKFEELKRVRTLTVYEN